MNNIENVAVEGFNGGRNKVDEWSLKGSDDGAL
jgi:hypothetical protein